MISTIVKKNKSPTKTYKNQTAYNNYNYCYYYFYNVNYSTFFHSTPFQNNFTNSNHTKYSRLTSKISVFQNVHQTLNRF